MSSPAGEADLTPEQLAACQRSGIKPESYAAAQQRQRDRAAARETLNAGTLGERIKRAAAWPRVIP
jgi:hypothetical protein